MLMWEQVKWAIVEIAREVCGSVKVGGKNPEYGGMIKERRLLGRNVLEATGEVTKKKIEKLKVVYIRSKRR